MQIAIKSGVVIATHSDYQDITDLYPRCLVLTIPDGTPVEIGQTWEVSLDTAKGAVCDAIDTMAEQLRNTVLTPGAGQMAAYIRKEAQARAFMVDAIPVAEDALAVFKKMYSAIYAEVGITADTPVDVARIVLANADAWYAFGDALESIRLGGKKAVKAASSVADVLAVQTAIQWPAL